MSKVSSSEQSQPFGNRFQPRDGGGSGKNKTRINEQITAREVRVVDSQGKMLGVKLTKEALELAYSQDLDLVEIAPQATPPVCKIIDYGKFVYEQQKRDKIQRKSQHNHQLKEIRFKAGTDSHDFEFKTRHAREFLLEGHKVKASLLFRGREIVHQSIGMKLMEEFVEALKDVSKVDQPIHAEGRSLSVLLSPEKAGKKEKDKDASKPKPKPKPQE